MSKLWMRKLLCAITICVIFGSSFVAVNSVSTGPFTTNVGSELDAETELPSNAVTDNIIDEDIASDDQGRSNHDFVGLLESLGGSISYDSHRVTGYYDSHGEGLSYSIDSSGNDIVIEVILGSYDLATYEFDEGAFDAVLIDGAQISSNPGMPALPYKNFLLRIPDGHEIINIDTRVIETERLSGLYVVPSPKPLALYAGFDIENRFCMDSEVYESNSFLRDGSIEYESLRRNGEEGILLSTYPLHYNPGDKHGELALSTRITISFDGPIQLQDVVFPSPEYAGADIGNYTIIAPESFLSILDDFVIWKTLLGFDVFVESLEDIYADYPSGDGPTKVRNYLNASYNQNSTDYVLLVGDADIMPVREVVDPAGGPGLDNGTEPSDLYYECLDGNWDSNGNGQFGEIDDDVDFMPELMVGRLPVQTASQARSVLAQIIDYERDPEAGDWFNDFLLIANDCFGTGDGPVMTEGMLNQKYLYDSFFDVYRAYSSDGSLSVSNVVSRLNAGVSIVDFFDHGAYDQWTDSLYTSDVTSLTNGNKTMFAFAMACETGAFDVEGIEPSISEAFFRNPNGGAHTYIGATRVAWAGYHCFDGFHNVFWEYFFETALALREVSPKLAMQQALHYMVTTFDMEVASTLETVYQAIYFGDPSLRMYWKHDVETHVDPIEVNAEATLNGTILQYNGQEPITGSIQVSIVDPLGTEVFNDIVTANSFGHFTAEFNSSGVPGLYKVQTTASSPYLSTSKTFFEVGTIQCTLTLDSEPVYNTYLSFSGTATSDGTGYARLLAADNTILQEEAIICSGGVYSSSINVTGFGHIRLLVTLDNATATGGIQSEFQMYRGDVLIIADDSGYAGPAYPGGWADTNVGDSSNQGDFALALQDEYNVSVFHSVNDGQPTIDLLNQFDVVIVTSGDNVEYPYESPDSYLLDILYSYADSGGHILFEGSSQLSGLDEFGGRPVLSNLAAVELDSQLTNAGGLYLAKETHPITSGIPGTIHLADGLGSPLADVVTPTNESVTVASYAGEYVGSSAITAQSASEMRGALVFMGFSIDAIENVNVRNLLVQNSLAFLMHPSLLLHISDDAMQTGSTQRIDVSVEDSGTGEPLEGVPVTFDGCGITASNTTLSDGTCSFEITPSSEGIISIEATKGGYLNCSAELIVYDTPIVKLQASPNYLERAGAQDIAVYASDYYEGFALENCLVNLTGLGNSLTGYTNGSGLIEFTVTPDGPGVILIEGTLSGYIGSSIDLPVIISALVLPGIGTYSPEDCCWDELMLHWEAYGDYPLDIDYMTFANLSEPITLSILESVGADVLIFGLPWDYIPSEQIDAIKTYVQSGHGLVASGGAMYYNSEDLSEFFGLQMLTDMDVAYPPTLSFDIMNTSHPLTSGIGNPYTAGYGFSVFPLGGTWSGSILNGAGYAALEPGSTPHAAMLTYHGMVYMSHIPEFQSNLADCQLVYNAITWSDYVLPDHDLAISLDIPLVQPGDSVNITATGRNLGLMQEANIDIDLYIDDILVDTLNIPLFDAGTTEELVHLWNPSLEGSYNVTARITAVAGEYSTLNNIFTRIVSVRELHNYYLFEGPFTWFDAKSNGIPLNLFGDDTSTDVGLPFSFTFYDSSFDTVFVSSNGWLSFSNANPWECSPVEFPSAMTSYQYALAPIWQDLVAENNIYVWSTEDFCAIQYDQYRHLSGNTIGTFEIVFYADGHIGFYYQQMYDVMYGTVGLNYGDGIFYNSVPPGTLSGETGYGLEFYYALPEHEMSVGLSCPTLVEAGSTVDIGVSMHNLGQATEYDIWLYLYINEVSVYQTLVATADPGLAFIHTHEWTVPEGTQHNVTAAISIVPGELNVENNVATCLVNVSDLANYMQIEDTYVWYDAVSNGTNINLSGDDVYSRWDLLFDFYYYDTMFDWVAISSNGWLSFVTSDPYEFIAQPFPNAGARYSYCVAPIWQDLQAESNVWVWSTPEFLVIQYQDYRYLGGDPLGTFQVVFHSTGLIQFNYQDMESVYGGTVGLNYGDGVHFNSYPASSLSYETEFGLTYTLDDDSPPEWVEVPGDITREAGTFFNYILYAEDNTDISSFTVNDTTHFSIESNGVLWNRERLDVGDYGLIVKAFDPVGNNVSAEFTIRIRDTTAPSWESMLVEAQLISGEDYELNVAAYDYCGVASYSVNHTYFAVNESQYLCNTLELTPGVYIIGVTAEDIYGNADTMTVVLTVEASEGQQFMMTMILTFAGITIAGLVIIVGLRKMRK